MQTMTVCPDQTRQLVMEFLEPMTENGAVDELWKAFVNELSQHAVLAARRALNQNAALQTSDVILSRLIPFLWDMSRVLEQVSENPKSLEPLVRMSLKLQDLNTYLSDVQLASPEATVPPSAAVILEKGGVP